MNHINTFDLFNWKIFGILRPYFIPELFTINDNSMKLDQLSSKKIVLSLKRTNRKVNKVKSQ